jgi:hypothetical protein
MTDSTLDPETVSTVEADSPYTGCRIKIGKIRPTGRGFLPVLRSTVSTYRTVTGTVSLPDRRAAVRLLVLQWLRRETERGRLSPARRAEAQAAMLLSALEVA